MTNQLPQVQYSANGTTRGRAVYGTPPRQMVLLGLEEERDTESAPADVTGCPDIRGAGEESTGHLSKEKVVRRIIEHLSKEQ
jgi:hypothetical protein